MVNWKTGQWNSHKQSSKKKKRTLKSEDSLSDSWNNIKWNNICIVSLPVEEREKKEEHLFEEIMTENFSNLGKETDIRPRNSRDFQDRLTTRH